MRRTLLLTTAQPASSKIRWGNPDVGRSISTDNSPAHRRGGELVLLALAPHLCASVWLGHVAIQSLP